MLFPTTVRFLDATCTSILLLMLIIGAAVTSAAYAEYRIHRECDQHNAVFFNDQRYACVMEFRGKAKQP